jgi:hypothetical protein
VTFSLNPSLLSLPVSNFEEEIRSPTTLLILLLVFFPSQFESRGLLLGSRRGKGSRMQRSDAVEIAAGSDWHVLYVVGVLPVCKLKTDFALGEDRRRRCLAGGRLEHYRQLYVQRWWMGCMRLGERRSSGDIQNPGRQRDCEPTPCLRIPWLDEREMTVEKKTGERQVRCSGGSAWLDICG